MKDIIPSFYVQVYVIPEVDGLQQVKKYTQPSFWMYMVVRGRLIRLRVGVNYFLAVREI